MSSSNFPGFERFFIVSNAQSRQAMRFRRARLADPSTAVSVLSEVRRSGRVATPDRLQHEAGSKLYDLLGTTLVADVVVSSKLTKTLRDCDATGWDIEPAEMTDRDGKKIREFFWLVVTGRCGKPAGRGSRIEIVRPNSGDGGLLYAEVGLSFDPATWDGSDVFQPEGYSLVCITEKVAHAIALAKLTNVSISPMIDYRIDLHDTRPSWA